MIIKPSIRSNVFTNAHPKGSKAYIESLIDETKALNSINGPKNVLIIGGSSGYGLSSRVALAFGAKANTLNVSFERAPKNGKTGTAGWWNNIHFQTLAKPLGTLHKDFVMDAFSKDTKKQVSEYIKKHLGTVDLVIYSLAAGGRPDSEGTLVRSKILPIGESEKGKTIDVAKKEVKDLTLHPATQKDIEDTVFVMGGGDWQDWIEGLLESESLSQNVKTISYTYIGSEVTYPIYRGGTLGKAKEDLEKRASEINKLLKHSLNGEALISSSKAVVTKASVFIPQMPLYVSCLFDVMKSKGVHETILQHKYRLFKDMVYGDERTTDSKGRLRMDAYELDPSIQKETIKCMSTLDEDELLNLQGTQDFYALFYNIHGFGFDSVNYKEAIDLDAYAQLKPE